MSRLVLFFSDDFCGERHKGTRAQGGAERQRGREAGFFLFFFVCFGGVGMLLAFLQGRGSSNRRAAEQQNSRTGG